LIKQDVILTLFIIIITKAFEFTGLGRGGQQIQRAKEVYTKAVETLVELASLQVKS
jgi:vacuolar-type H+-ATPase subunit D/Vma8